MRKKTFDELISASAIERHIALKELGYEGAELFNMYHQLMLGQIEFKKDVAKKSADTAREILNKTIF